MDSEASARAYFHRDPGPITAAFRFVSRRVGELSALQLLDEESLTSSVLGGLAVACPLMLKMHGSGADGERLCSWGPYSKSGRAGSKQSEATSGADFALVLWESAMWARVAVFQAKKGTVKVEVNEEREHLTKWFVNVHRMPRKKANDLEGLRKTQLAALVDTGNIGRREHLRATQQSSGPPAEHKPDVDTNQQHPQVVGMDWIHYIVYRDGDPICLPLSQIDKMTVQKELRSRGGSSYAPIRGDQTTTFFDVLHAGLDHECPTSWLRLDVDGVKAVIGELVELMTVIVGDEQSGHPLTPVPDGGGIQTDVAKPVVAPDPDVGSAFKLS